MKVRPLAVAAVLLALAGVVWLALAPRSPMRAPVRQESVPGVGDSAATVNPNAKPGAAAPAPPAASPPAMPPAAYSVAERGETTEVEARQDLDRVHLMLRDYRSIFGENPVGTNAEIMATLNGGNPRQARLGPADGAGLNGKGELVDRWGTPYFFHQIDSRHMEVHSAGPDRKMGTSDDIVMP